MDVGYSEPNHVKSCVFLALSFLLCFLGLLCVFDLVQLCLGGLVVIVSFVIGKL